MDAVGSWLQYALANEFLDEPAEWIILSVALVLLGGALVRRQPTATVSPVVAPRNGVGIAAMVLGILAALVAWTGVGGWILGLAAEGTGLAGHRRCQRGTATNINQARAGTVLGFVSVLVGLVFNAIWQDFSKAPL